MTRFLYAIQNRVLAADCALPFLAPLAADAPPDITLTLTAQVDQPQRRVVWYRSDDDSEATVIARSADAFVIEFADGTSFVISAHGRVIALATAPEDHGVADLAAYALGPVLAFALHLQGAVLLHASGVAIRGRSVLFCGPSGSGKSTTAAILGQQNYDIISDDLTEISDRPPHQILPSDGLLRLWSDSVEQLYGDASALPELAPSWPKRTIPIAANGARAAAAILLLDPAERAAHPRLERLSSKTAWSALMKNAFTARLPDEGLPERMSQRIFSVIASFADTTPAYAFAPPEIAHAATLGRWLEEKLEAHL